MQEQWTIVENNFWHRKWFFFKQFDKGQASLTAYRLMFRAFCEAGIPIMIDEQERIVHAFVGFIKKNSDLKWSTRFPYLCIGIQPAKDPRRFALKITRCPYPVRPKTAEVEWTYDYRPGSKIQGRQIDEHEI